MKQRDPETDAEEIRILFLGDLCGEPGRRIVRTLLPRLRNTYRPDLVIVNGENAAAGFGISPKIFRELMEHGIDVVTLGNHALHRREIFPVLNEVHDETSPIRIIRPANLPEAAPGVGMTIVPVRSDRIRTRLVRVAVYNLQGRVFMPPIDCPFHEADRMIGITPEDVVIRFLDFHAEATSEKQMIGRYLDGRVSAVIGTHTHVQTADETIFPHGTAFLNDVGMCGAAESLIGCRIEPLLATIHTGYSVRPEVASGPAILRGCLVSVHAGTGKASFIERIQWDETAENGICKNGTPWRTP
ncbi:MAG: TIGR00282 family metallophosphoesterase [Planctomycetia bacterium]|nr:TIGR00282 family metallophosphoesterase [Planctomycetia bacterium]